MAKLKPEDIVLNSKIALRIKELRVKTNQINQNLLNVIL